MLTTQFHGSTDIGLVRKKNEDAFLSETVWEGQAVLFAAIDGVGGYAGGEVAADIAQAVIRQYVENHADRSNPLLTLKGAVVEANNAIITEKQRNPAYAQMGCCITAALVDQTQERLYVAHVGDTRLYVWEKGKLTKLTHDHSLVGYREEMGDLTEEEAMSHPQRNVIEKFAGDRVLSLHDDYVEGAIFPLNADAVVMLCSDGLTDLVTAREVSTTLETDMPVALKTAELIHKAKDRGGKDNITVVVAAIGRKRENPVLRPSTVQAGNHVVASLRGGGRQREQKKISRYAKTIAAMMVVFFLVAGGATWILHSHSPLFQATEKAYDSHDALNLDNALSQAALKQLLVGNGYVEDNRDAAFIASQLCHQLEKHHSLHNLGALNTEEFRCIAEEAYSQGGEGLRERVEESRIKLGWNAEIDTLYQTGSAPTICEQPGGDTWLTVSVASRRDSLSIPAVLWARLTGTYRTPERGVIVRLREHYYEGEADDKGQIQHPLAADSLVGYASTDADGKARFRVRKGCYYSVLPVRQGYEYGSSKGTTTHAVKGDCHYSFEQRLHRIPLFDPVTYNTIKSDGSLTVRMPAQYKNHLIFGVAAFIIVWFLAMMTILLRDLRERHDADHRLPLVAMTLTALALLMMYAIARPLTDSLAGSDTVWGIVIGVVALTLLSNVNILRLHESVTAPLSRFTSRLTASDKRYQTEGLAYGILALALMLLLYLFGSGPEGSDAKVNLWGFQPSELTKLLIVLLMATFFAKNAHRIQTFSQLTTRFNLRKQLTTVSMVILAMAVLLFMYVKLSDLGPALVVSVTFIMLYSVARNDLLQLLVGTASFVLLLWVAHTLNPGSVATALTFAAMWFFCWIAGGLLWKRRIFESALFMNLLIATFLFGGRVMTEIGMSEGVRLERRNEMAWSGAWNNNVPGGDQVAQGIWSLATGGLTGQGLGRGNASLVPACTTDMIFTSIGESLGWVALCVVVICFVVLLHRGLLLGRRAGHPFAFFLAGGIALVTATQFLVITAGSIGLIPLTGVSLPMLSFGKSAMIVNLAAVGIVVSLSRMRATKNQSADIRRYDNVVAGASGSFIVLAAVILATTLSYQLFRRDHFLLKPAYVANNEGFRIQEYNPRINLLVSRMPMGDIYDRNGLPLATCSTDSLSSYSDRLVEAGLEAQDLKRLGQRRQRRYYPFGDHLFFMTGDFNSRVLWNNNEMNPYGYMAENTHLAWLRGFDNTARDKEGRLLADSLSVRQVRTSRFLYPVNPYDKEIYARRDYSELLPLLKKGADSKVAQTWNKHRDLRLAVDARLQTMLQTKMADNGFDGFTHRYRNKMRASVVVLDAENGDLLCSANYPLADQRVIRSHSDLPYYEVSEKDRSFNAFTDRDLGLTFQTKPGSTAKILSAMAAFMKYGSDAETFGYQLLGGERIAHTDTTYLTMREAMVRSSNSYFIKLVHDKRLYTELDSLYKNLGFNIQIDPFPGNRHHCRSITPYFFSRNQLDSRRSTAYDAEVGFLSKAAYEKWDSYVARREADPRHVERFSDPKLGWTVCGSAWGQYNIKATPLNVAQAVAAVVNGGTAQPVRFAYDDTIPSQPVRLIDQSSAVRLQDIMTAEAAKWPQHHLPAGTGGKTGTPIRLLWGKNVNDAWYACFLPKKDGGHLAVAVRLEHSVTNSKAAVKYLADVVLPVLKATGYIPQ